MSELAKGTEVLTAGGLIGKITKVTEGAEIVKVATSCYERFDVGGFGNNNFSISA